MRLVAVMIVFLSMMFVSAQWASAEAHAVVSRGGEIHGDDAGLSRGPIELHAAQAVVEAHRTEVRSVHFGCPDLGCCDRADGACHCGAGCSADLLSPAESVDMSVRPMVIRSSSSDATAGGLTIPPLIGPPRPLA